MRDVGRSEGAGVRAAGLVIAGVAVVGLGFAPAAAQTPEASPKPPTVTGQVSGARAAGGEVEIRIEALMPGGWQGLHLVEAVVLVDGREAERLTYDIEDARLTVGDQRIFAGTGASASGGYLRVNGSRVIVTTGGGNLALRIRADVLRAIPERAAFELSVTGDRGERVAIRRSIAAPEQGGLSWGTVVTAVLVALLAGGFVGNVVASRRRPPPRLSVYGTIQRRLEAQRSEAETSGRTDGSA